MPGSKIIGGDSTTVWSIDSSVVPPTPPPVPVMYSDIWLGKAPDVSDIWIAQRELQSDLWIEAINY